MKSIAIILASGLALFAQAAPAVEATKTGTPELITFDDLNVTALSPLLNKPPRGYGGLRWGGITTQSTAVRLNGLLPVLTPESGNQTAIFSTVTQLTANGGPPRIIKLTPGHIKLESMYAGCSANTGLTTLPAACFLTATTFTNNGVKHEQKFTLPANSTLTKCHFSKKFHHTNETRFIISGLLDLVLTVSLDNLKYELFDKTV